MPIVLAVALLLGIGFTCYSRNSISQVQFLLAQPFEGTYVPDSQSAKSERVNLRFLQAPSDEPDRGTYAMKIGTRTLAGEWNIYPHGIGHLWVDTVDGKKNSHEEGTKRLPTPMSFYFRIPIRVDDPWIARPSPNDDIESFDGILNMLNIPNERFRHGPNLSEFRIR